MCNQRCKLSTSFYHIYSQSLLDNLLIAPNKKKIFGSDFSESNQWQMEGSTVVSVSGGFNASAN